MTKIAQRIAQLRKEKSLSQTALAKEVGVSREAIGKYERGEATASVETAKKIADAFDVTLDYLVDDSAAGSFDKRTVSRIQELQSLPAEEQNHVFAILDAFLRDAKTRSAYATS
jgi:transcriptional regulator with XRE-family HTH domain